MIKIKHFLIILFALTFSFTYQIFAAETGNLKKIAALNQKTEKLITEGEYDKALKSITETLSLQEIEFGLMHYSVAESLGALATIYYHLGKFEKADSLYERIMAIYENELGSEHVEVGISLNNLGQLYLGSGDYIKAQQLFKKALIICEKKLGTEDPNTVMVLNNLGVLNLNRANYDEAKQLFEKALIGAKKHYGSKHPKVAYCLNNLGKLYYQLNKYSKSESFYKKALKLHENYYGFNHPEVVISLNNLALLYLNLGNQTKAEPLFNKALHISEKSLGLEHPTTAMLLNNLAFLNTRLGKYKTAISRYKKVLAIQKKVYGTENDLVATTLNNLAQVYSNIGKYSKAEPLFNKALVITEKLLGSEHPNIAMISNNLGFIYHDFGEYTKAESAFKKALNIYEKSYGSDHVQIATSLNNLAILYQDMNKYEIAEQMYKRALVIDKQILGSDHFKVARDLNNLALFYKKLGDYDQAELLYKQALVIYENNLEADHPFLATVRSNLAVFYNDIGENSKAKRLYQSVLAMREKVLGPNHVLVADSLNNLGTFYSHEGDLIKANKLFDRALNIYLTAIGPENKQVARVHGNLANVYEKLRKYEKAQNYYEKSLKMYEKIYGPEHTEVSDMMITLALLYAKQGDLINAHRLTVQAQETNNKLIDHVMGFTSNKKKLDFLISKESSLHITLSLLFHPLSHNLYLTDEHQFLHLLCRAQTLIFKTLNVFLGLKSSPTLCSKKLANQKDILNIWLKRKGVLLETQKQYHKALFYSDNKQISQTSIELSKVRNRLSKLIFPKPNQENIDPYQNEIAQLEKQKEELEATLSKLSKVFAIKQNKSNANCDHLTQAMPSNTAMVDFARVSQYNFENKNDGQTWLPDRYIAFIIHAGNGDEIGWIDLGPADEIDNKISAFRKMLAGVNTDMTNDTIKILKKLHTLIFQPIKSKIADTKEIFISPDGDLSLLPFEILLNNDGKFLIEDYTFNYLSTGRDIFGFGETSEGNNRSLIMGNPDFDMNSAQKKPIIEKLELKTHNERKMTRRSKDTRRSGSWISLPGTQDEVQTIYNLIGKEKADIFTGKKATEEKLMYWGVPKVLHIATHGFFLENKPIDFKNNDGMNRGFSVQESTDQIGSPSPIYIDTENPLLRSGIVLAGANKILEMDNDTISDGIVTSEEILGMNLRGTEMVVLSACDTGLGEVQNGEGVFGLRRAFTQAGAKSLIMSLWKVPDQETKELMINCYRNIYEKKMDRCRALRQATLKQIQITRQRYGNANPYYWGSFVFMGEP